MIFGNIRNLQEFSGLNAEIKKCFQYAARNNLLNFENGIYEIHGKDIYVNIVEYTTSPVEKCIWEAHKKYLDIHLVLCGKERIDLNFIQNMTVRTYKAQLDYLSLDGNKNSSLVLTAGDYLICFPSDGHCTSISVEEPQKVKKAIFKIKIT